MDGRYVPVHHAACCCELCWAVAMTPQVPIAKRAQEEAAATMALYASFAKPTKGHVPALAGMEGKTVHFAWTHRNPDPSGSAHAQAWTEARAARCIANERGMVLLDIEYAPPRWWPLRAFAWLEVREPTCEEVIASLEKPPC